MDHVKRAQEILDIEIEGIRKVRDTLGASFSDAVELILASLKKGGKIVVTGLGKNYHIGQKMAATLTSTGSPALVLHPAEAMHGDMGIISSGDVVLALSYSGASDELLALLPLIKRYDVPIIGLTGDPSSTLAQHSSVVILVAVDREACPLNISPTSSTTATLAVGDALAMVLLKARGFTRDDYAKLHPGGSIGKTLLLKARDIMRTGGRVAAITSGGCVKEAMLAMTAARAGSVIVLDEERRVLGIFTDGDLRRNLTGSPDIVNAAIDTVMTKNPVTLRDNQLAVDVLAYFRDHQIDDLIIVDQEGRLAGMIDIQDLPKLKMF